VVGRDSRVGDEARTWLPWSRPVRTRLAVTLLTAIAGGLAGAGGIPILAPGSAAAATPALVQVASATEPVHVAAAPGDARRLFVVEKPGLVRVFRDGGLLDDPFLDLTDGLFTAGEGGLLSIAFAPDYASSGRLYTFRSGLDRHAYVEEFVRSAASADRADPASRRLVLRIPHTLADNHWGGQLQFGPDGLLYVSLGDGGGGNDPEDNAENLASPLGKLLRIDPRPTDTAAYRVPADNPFVSTAGARPEIYAYGLRNPWRFSFDRLTGDLTIGDVGQDTWEEIDFTPRGEAAGAFFGWDMFEGFAPLEPGTAGPHLPPVHVYGRAGGACSITGGYVVRDPALASLAGRYLYADFCTGAIRSIRLAAGSATEDAATGLALALPVSFGEDLGGCLYAVSLHGPIYRVAETLFPAAPCAPPPPPAAPADTSAPETLLDSGPAPLTRERAASFAFRADEQGARFECSLDGAAFAACFSPHGTSGLADGSHRFRVRALDEAGNADATPAGRDWTVDATPPETSVVRGPAARTTRRMGAAEFASSEAGGIFTCALDGAAEAPCSSPLALGPLREGAHVLAVRAVDAAGNADPSPAAHAWRVDLDPLRRTALDHLAGRLARAVRRGGLQGLRSGRPLPFRFTTAAPGVLTARINAGARLLAAGRVVADGRSARRLVLRRAGLTRGAPPARVTLRLAFTRPGGGAAVTVRRTVPTR
jgi:Glucose / Sorbosone dehydrogenase